LEDLPSQQRIMRSDNKEAETEGAITLLNQAVSIRSYSGEEKEIARFLVKEMERLGFRSFIDEAGNAIGMIGKEGAERTLLFAGHMDTVAGEIPVRITNDPDATCDKSQVLYGRGSVDAKGPLCAFIEGAARARPDLPAGLNIVVAGCVEEECASSKGARHLIGRYKPDMIVIGEPSGTNGITLGYKGRLLIDYSLKVEEAHGASENVGAGEQAIMFFSGMQEFAAGFNSGAGNNGVEKGKIGKAELAKSFEQLQLRLRDINTSSDGLHEKVEMRLSLRIPPGCDIKEIKRFANGIKGMAKLTFSGEELPIKAEKNNVLVRAFVKAIRESGDGGEGEAGEGGADGNGKIQPCFKLKTGTSDMNVLGSAYPEVPILAYGPGDSSMDHTPNEHIMLDEYLTAIEVIRRVLESL
jgi:[amino group carrier protein]-lysine/ornithine hydrolase